MNNKMELDVVIEKWQRPSVRSTDGMDRSASTSGLRSLCKGVGSLPCTDGVSGGLLSP